MSQDKQLPAMWRENPPQKFLTTLGGTAEQWEVMTKQFFPAARAPETVVLVASYCKARKLDMMSKPFHIVPAYNAQTQQMEDTIWPSVTLFEIQAHRTGEFAGADAPEYGELLNWTFTARAGEKTIEAPKSVKLTVYRRKAGSQIRDPYTAEVFFTECVKVIKGSKSDKAGWPNDRWETAPRQMLAKCALAAALRLAFPEEVGSEPTAEEMHGATIDIEANVISDEGTQVLLRQAGTSGKVHAKPSPASSQSSTTDAAQDGGSEIVDAEIHANQPTPNNATTSGGPTSPPEASDPLLTGADRAAFLEGVKPLGWDGKRVVAWLQARGVKHTEMRASHATAINAEINAELDKQ